jgi:hypothetical protein
MGKCKNENGEHIREGHQFYQEENSVILRWEFLIRWESTNGSDPG